MVYASVTYLHKGSIETGHSPGGTGSLAKRDRLSVRKGWRGTEGEGRGRYLISVHLAHGEVIRSDCR